MKNKKNEKKFEAERAARLARWTDDLAELKYLVGRPQNKEDLENDLAGLVKVLALSDRDLKTRRRLTNAYAELMKTIIFALDHRVYFEASLDKIEELVKAHRTLVADLAKVAKSRKLPW